MDQENREEIAEQVFIILAREWLLEVEKTPTTYPLPSSADDQALACLLLATEYGAHFNDLCWQQVEQNCLATKNRDWRTWMDKLSWQLCYMPRRENEIQEIRKKAIDCLIANLSHHNSVIRCWIMEMAWFVIRWLETQRTASKLFKNLADTLIGPLMAGGLAARLYGSEKEFFYFAKTYIPSDGFEDQYFERLTLIEQEGIKAVQAPFRETEARCRKEIDRVLLSLL